jgi:hypothetical protein
VSTCRNQYLPTRELRVRVPDKATLTKATREDFAAPGTIADAIMVVDRRRRRGLR